MTRLRLPAQRITGTAATSYTNNSILEFFDSSSASSASFTNNAVMDFFDSSRAGTATITNAGTGTLTFNNTSSADHASITNSGTLNFTNSSTAGSATITGSGNVTFYNTSTAASSTIDLSGGTLSFRDKTGRLCRSFDTARLAGIACRDDDGWRLRLALQTGDGNRSGSSESPFVGQAIDAMIAGDPLDAGEERAARDRGWR